MNLVHRFAANVSGNFGMMAAGLSIPLLLAAGLSIDYTRHTSAARHIQDLADSTSLVLAGSKETNEGKLRVMAEQFISVNAAAARLENVVLVSLKADADRVTVNLNGDIPATFISIAGFDRLNTRAAATAERAVRGNVEIALILDNTYSMAGPENNGDLSMQKINTLKTAATGLVDKLLETQDGAVKIGLVPYADYVNVGTQYRNASWLDVPDNETTTTPKTCEMKDVSTTKCLKPKPNKTCTRVVDGITEAYSCSDGCEPGQSVTTVVHKEVCSGGTTTTKKWFGCVGSRMVGDTRLHDNSPSVTYPGFIDTSQKCLNPIVPLTASKASLKTAISGMIINIGSYKPNTYIPGGLIWGLNVLSPGQPFAEPQEYDAKNQRPRKVAILMTDGENTMRFVAADGKHAAVTINASDSTKTKAQKVAQLAATDSDTTAICTYMKSQGIEIYSVAFMVTDADAKNVLQSCATSGEHYFDATDPDALLAAFSGIGDALRVVRLVN